MKMGPPPSVQKGGGGIGFLRCAAIGFCFLVFVFAMFLSLRVSKGAEGGSSPDQTTRGAGGGGGQSSPLRSDGGGPQSISPAVGGGSSGGSCEPYIALAGKLEATIGQLQKQVAAAAPPPPPPSAAVEEVEALRAEIKRLKAHVEALRLKSSPESPPPPSSESSFLASQRSLTLFDNNSGGGGNMTKVKSLMKFFDQPEDLEKEMLTKWGGLGEDPQYPGEEGYVFNLRRAPMTKGGSITYDPKKDYIYPPLNLPNSSSPSPNALPASRRNYALSPVPKNSWSITFPDTNKTLTMDELVFAYDLWYEANAVFSMQSWMGVYCQQDPSDGYAIADMLWRVKPDLIIEVGTNSGGGAIFYSTFMRAYNPNGKIVTLDIRDVSNWNGNNPACVGCVSARDHPWWHDGMITFIRGDVATDGSIQRRIEKEFVAKAKTVLVIEDAGHSTAGSRAIMEVTHKWVTKGSYLLVQDTKLDRFAHRYRLLPQQTYGPMRAVDDFMEVHGDEFAIDRRFEYFMYSQHHRGWLRRKK